MSLFKPEAKQDVATDAETALIGLIKRLAYDSAHWDEILDHREHDRETARLAALALKR